MWDVAGSGTLNASVGCGGKWEVGSRLFLNIGGMWEIDLTNRWEVGLVGGGLSQLAEGWKLPPPRQTGMKLRC